MKPSLNINISSTNSANQHSSWWLMIVWSIGLHFLLIIGIAIISRHQFFKKPIPEFINAQLISLPSNRVTSPVTKVTSAHKPQVIKKAPELVAEKKKPDITLSPKNIKKEAPKKPQIKKSQKPSNRKSTTEKPKSLMQESKSIGGVFQSQPGLSSFDIHSLHYTWYQSIVTNKLRSNWATSIADEKSHNIKVVVSFAILRNGSITDIRILKTSGISILDLAVKRAVINSSPLPPLPVEFKRSKLYAQYEFVY